MGKITQKIVDRKEAPKPSRKRRKKELDKIHSKILKAKKTLDNVEKGSFKDRQRKQGRARICNRLLPKLDAGIYRNGTKSKNIRKETSENIFDKARLNADALKLFNGDTPESKCIIEISSDDETKKSPNKGFVKHSLEWTPGTLEQSPDLTKGQCQNKNVCIKKKGKDNGFQKVDPNKIIKQKINDELKYAVQKEDICKRRLFQNDKEQLTNKVEAITTQSQMYDNTDQTKDNRENEKKIEQSCSKDSESKSWDPLIRYTEFCKITSAENFESNFLQNYQPDPVTTTLQKLRHAYTDTFRLQLLREKNNQELNVESPAVSEEYQACTNSNVSQFSPVEFEVPKCIENHTIATRLQDVSQKNNKSHFIQNAEFQKSSGITPCSSISCSTQQNTSTTYDTNSFIVENQENNDQYAKQSSGINQLPRPASFCFVNEKNPIHLGSQRVSKHISHPSKSNWNKDNFHIDISDHRNAQCIDNAKYVKNLIFTSDSVLPAKGHLSKDYFHEKLSTDNYPSKDTLSKCDDKANVKNVKRVPTILRRCNVIINKNNHSVQINDDCPEDLYKRSTMNLFNKTPDQNINNEFYETEFPNMFKNLATPSTVSARNRSKLSEFQSGPMEIKDTRESQVDEFDINICSDELSRRRNKFSRFDESSHSQTSETSYDTNAYSEKSSQQEQIASNTRKHLHSNYCPINYLQRANFLNIDVESTKRMQQTTRQAKLHTRETSDTGERDQNQNILFNDVNNRMIPTATLSFSQNVQTDKKSREPTCEETFHANCKKNQTNTCRCNEQYLYFDSTHCSRKYNNMSQAQHFCEDTVQPKASYNIKSYNNDTNDCINQSNGMRSIPLLPVEQKHKPCMYLKVTDDQPRAMLLQNVTQPVKYLAVKNESGIQRIPVYINDRNIKVAENVPLKVVALMDSNTQPKAFPREVVPQAVPLQTNDLQFDDFATHKTNNQFVVKHLNPMNTILLNPDSQSSIWYASSL
ncbi:uncharacterized protein [Linepithema humile]|uniref:uncharacterized protein isoform X2 n=1 Tax=Linepithema humile TaxID=83485 RepID=UPI00062308BE|nr:PREDICTED: uncharacterized protein LOC105674060 isoform X2 [Linepithema humile]